MQPLRGNSAPLFAGTRCAKTMSGAAYLSVSRPRSHVRLHACHLDDAMSMDKMSEAAARALWRTCLHEYAHLVVARYFGAAGFVTIARGTASEASYGGQFQMYGELADDEWRIVALAGAVAERVDEEPCVETALLAAALRTEPGLLSGVDAALAGDFVEADVERCLRLVKKLWREIASEAGERVGGAGRSSAASDC